MNVTLYRIYPAESHIHRFGSGAEDAGGISGERVVWKSKMAGLWIRVNERGAYGGRAGFGGGKGRESERGSLTVKGEGPAVRALAAARQLKGRRGWGRD
jgi:hypothetical protein